MILRPKTRTEIFKFKEEIEVFNDETKSQVNFKINADRWLDFSASYSFTDPSGKLLGKVARKGMKSIWKAEYHIIDQNEQQQYTIQEENAWIRVLDELLGQIPILSFFTGYLFNPAYLVKDKNDQVVLKLTKERSLLGRTFELNEIKKTDSDDDYRIMLGLMMMLLLERRRG